MLDEDPRRRLEPRRPPLRPWDPECVLVALELPPEERGLYRFFFGMKKIRLLEEMLPAHDFDCALGCTSIGCDAFIEPFIWHTAVKKSSSTGKSMHAKPVLKSATSRRNNCSYKKTRTILKLDSLDDSSRDQNSSNRRAGGIALTHRLHMLLHRPLCPVPASCLKSATLRRSAKATKSTHETTRHAGN